MEGGREESRVEKKEKMQGGQVVWMLRKEEERKGRRAARRKKALHSHCIALHSGSEIRRHERSTGEVGFKF